MNRHYKAEIVRDDKWWMVHIPEIDGLTQARRLSEAAKMGREYIALATDTPISDIAVDIVSVTVPGIGNVAIRASTIREHRDAVQAAAAAANQEARDYAAALTAAGVPVRDAAELLGVSPQRISQLTEQDKQ